jgi:enoyl-CoA hydratase
MPDPTALRVHRDDAIGTITLSRPDARNAMNAAFFDELPEAVHELDADDAVRVVVLQGAGPAFCAGLDLREIAPAVLQGAGASVEERRKLYGLIQHMQAALSAVADASKPVLAKINGPCIGGGVDLATACDIRLATSDAVFSVRETKLAMVADLGTLQRLQHIVPQGHVAELVYTGGDIDAERAAAIGLVNHVYPDAEALDAATREMARTIAANAPLAVQGAKHVLRKGRTQSTSDGLDYVALWNAAFLQSEDLHEAMQAYRERRAPEFEGR